jgi:hypothetical protein
MTTAHLQYKIFDWLRLRETLSYNNLSNTAKSNFYYSSMGQDTLVENTHKTSATKFERLHNEIQTLVKVPFKNERINALTGTTSPYEDSRGLFQVNTFSHTKVNSSMLYDPEYNATYQMKNLKPVYDEGVKKGLTGVVLTEYVEKYGQRPQWTQTVSNNISKYYNEYTGGSNSMWDGTNEGLQGENGKINILDVVKFYSMDFMLFILLLFSLYMVFINKGGK